ncbi:unnamed protein product [Rotaria sordida]|uniref:Uncharacterized protein n=1 Tax=Rotaria sordida TaxID=392033 RepID=A0A814ZE71_9BILA|nr:unnamed protein product [Rotaria sordida]CAF1524541.1 unnamed protein product [Rotaria sordida]
MAVNILTSFLRDDTHVAEGSEDVSSFFRDDTNATEGDEDISSFLLKDINLPGNNQIIFASQQGQQRSFEHHTDIMENEKRSNLSNDVSSEDMPTRPKDPKVIQHLTQATNTSLNDKGNTIFHQDTSLVDILNILNMNEDQLKLCNKKSSTATARLVIKFLFSHPDSNFSYVEADKIVVDTIIKYTKLSNPNDNKSNADVRRAISNYFSCLNYQRKIRRNH